MAHFFPEGQEPKYDKLRIAGVFKELESKIVRWNILDTGKRIDGRDSKTVRNIVAEVGILPRAPPRPAAASRIPLHGACGLRDHRIQRLVVDGLGVRRLAGADGCGRSLEATDRGHRD